MSINCLEILNNFFKIDGSNKIVSLGWSRLKVLVLTAGKY